MIIEIIGEKTFDRNQPPINPSEADVAQWLRSMLNPIGSIPIRFKPFFLENGVLTECIA